MPACLRSGAAIPAGDAGAHGEGIGTEAISMTTWVWRKGVKEYGVRHCRACSHYTRWHSDRPTSDKVQAMRRDGGKGMPGNLPDKKIAHAKWAIFLIWRRGRESNPSKRLCRPLHNLFATSPEDLLGCAAQHTVKLEREKSLELSTSTLARLRSTN